MPRVALITGGNRGLGRTPRLGGGVPDCGADLRMV